MLRPYLRAGIVAAGRGGDFRVFVSIVFRCSGGAHPGTRLGVSSGVVAELAGWAGEPIQLFDGSTL
jgi:hypothetical protein